MTEEQVICFRKEVLDEGANGSGVFYDEELQRRILDNLESVARSAAEKDYRFKQLVIYAVIKCGDLFLTYRRTPKTGEERLRNRYSMGIGGHVNIDDTSQLTLFGSGGREGFLVEALWREVNEEVSIKPEILSEPEIICFINSDSTDVDKVHFGTVWLIRIGKPEVFLKKERGIGKLEFLDLQHLQMEKEKFEGWSQMLIDHFSSQ
jgi:predicted NUDIX family phosphoesterase